MGGRDTELLEETYQCSGEGGGGLALEVYKFLRPSKMGKEARGLGVFITSEAIFF
jgi:hypothetical protein